MASTSRQNSGRVVGHGHIHREKKNVKRHLSGSTPINPLKSKIRDVTRLLEHGDHLPPGVRIEKERALAGYEHELQQARDEKKRQQMISKYHMVRFFERRKATRNLKQLRSRLAAMESTSGDRSGLETSILEAEVNLNYTMYYPLTIKYISLFPRSNGKTGGGSTDAAKDPSKPPLWPLVKQCMESDTLDKLRDGKFLVNHDGTEQKEHVTPKPAPKVSVASQSASKVKISGHHEQGEDREDSDGGFFEE